MVDSELRKFFLKKKKILLSFINHLLVTLIPFYSSILQKVKLLLDKNPEFKQRTFYGTIFAGTILIPLLYGGIIYMITVFIILCMMIFELLKIVSNIEVSNNRMFILLRRSGLIYISVCCISLILIRESTQGLVISIWLFLSLWSVDSFAYIFGKKFGKLKLAPNISPNKTYEGAIMGTISGFFVSIILYKFFLTTNGNHMSIVSFSIFSLIVIILAQLSDLSESYIKRQCLVKDSGNIIPCHGGMLDRFDSFLLTAPFVFIIVWLNGGILF